MAVHDWSRVDAGIFHAFHLAWIAALQNVLNDGRLPEGYYVLAEQVAGDATPDVLTLERRPASSQPSESGGVAAPPVPKTRFHATIVPDAYVRRRRSLMIRHVSDDQIVAMLEILSPGNKAGSVEWRRFLNKAVSALQNGIHLLLVDLHAPTRRDPRVLHAALMDELGGEPFEPPADKPLTLVAYVAGLEIEAFVEPIAVGDPLPPMPLFLTPELHIATPLEETYQQAWNGVPARWRGVLEGLYKPFQNPLDKINIGKDPWAC